MAGFTKEEMDYILGSSSSTPQTATQSQQPQLGASLGTFVSQDEFDKLVDDRDKPATDTAVAPKPESLGWTAPLTESFKGLARGTLDVARNVTGAIPEMAGGYLAAQADVIRQSPAAMGPGAIPPANFDYKAAQTAVQQAPTPNPMAGQAAAAEQFFAPYANAPSIQANPTVANTEYLGNAPLWTKATKLASDVGQGAPSVAAAIAGSVVGGPVGAGIAGGALTAAPWYEKAKQSGLSDKEALAGAAVIGAGSTVLNSQPFLEELPDMVPAAVKGRIATFVAKGIAEAGTETVEGGLNPFAEIASGQRKITSLKDFETLLADTYFGIKAESGTIPASFLLGGMIPGGANREQGPTPNVPAKVELAAEASKIYEDLKKSTDPRGPQPIEPDSTDALYEEIAKSFETPEQPATMPQEAPVVQEADALTPEDLRAIQNNNQNELRGLRGKYGADTVSVLVAQSRYGDPIDLAKAKEDGAARAAERAKERERAFSPEGIAESNAKELARVEADTKLKNEKFSELGGDSIEPGIYYDNAAEAQYEVIKSKNGDLLIMHGRPGDMRPLGGVRSGNADSQAIYFALQIKDGSAVRTQEATTLPASPSQSAPEPITQPEPIPVAPERGQGPVERPAEVGVPISPSRASVRAQGRPYPGERQTTTTGAPQFRGAIRRRGGEAVAAEATPVQEPQSRAVAPPSQEPVMEAQSAPFDLTTMPMEQIDAFMADEDARMDAKEQEVAKKYLTQEQQKIFNSIPNTEYGYRRKAKMFSNVSDEASDAFDDTAMADSPETARRYRQVEMLREKLDKFTAGGVIEDEAEANKDLEIFLRSANFDDPVDVRVLQELTQRYDAAGLDVNKMLRTARAAYGTWFYAQTKDVNDALDMVASLDAKLGIPAQAEEPSSKPAAEFVGLQDRPRGQEPIALYNIPTPDGGKTTVTAETAKERGFAVPEPPAPQTAKDKLIALRDKPKAPDTRKISEMRVDERDKLIDTVKSMPGIMPSGGGDTYVSLEADIDAIAKMNPNIVFAAKDYNGARREFLAPDFARLVKKQWFTDRLREVRVGFWDYTGRGTPEFMGEDGDAFRKQIGKDAEEPLIEVEAIPGVVLSNNSTVRPDRMNDFQRAVADPIVRDYIQEFGIKTIDIVAPGKLRLSEQGNISLKEKNIQLSSEASDPRHTILHEIAHVIYDNMTPEQKKNWVDISDSIGAEEVAGYKHGARTNHVEIFAETFAHQGKPWADDAISRSKQHDAPSLPTTQPQEPVQAQSPVRATEIAQEPEATQKQPWEMTRSEVRDQRIGGGQEVFRRWTTTTGRSGKSMRDKNDMSDWMSKEEQRVYSDHEAAVEQAIASGKTVPPEVLADYPDLAPEAPVAMSDKDKNKRLESITKLKGVEERSAGLFYVPEKLMVPARRKGLERGTSDFELKAWADVTGNPSDRGWAVVDRRATNVSRAKQPAPAKPEAPKAAAPPRASKAAQKLAKDRVDKHGLTKDQMKFLTEEIQARWSELPVESPDNKLERTNTSAVIKVPGDGTFIIESQLAANAIYKRLTGKWIDESMAYDSKKSGGSSPVDPRTTPDYMKGGYSGDVAGAAKRLKAEDEALRLLNEAKTPNDVAYARIQYDRAMGVKEAAPKAIEKPVEEAPAAAKSAPKTTASEKQPYEMTSEEYFKSELEKNRYKSKYEQDPKAMANLRNIKEQEWLDMLYAQAEVDTLPLNVIDDYVSRFGEGELKRRFRGRLEKGIAGWMPTDVRREGTNRETFYGFTDGEKPLKAGMIAKALNREQQFTEGKMTIRQWIDKKYTAGELSAASEVKNKMTDMERERLAKHRETFRNSPNKELEAKAKKEKTVYTVNGIDLGKVAYDYAKYRLDTEASMLESRTTEQQSNPEQAKAPEIVANTESARFRQEELGKVLPNFERMVKREASPQNMLIVAEQFMDGEAPYIKEAIASRLWEISPEAAALGSELKYGRGDVFKRTQPESSMPDVTSQPATTTASVPKKTTVKRILDAVPSDVLTYDPANNTISFDSSDAGITKVRDAVGKALDSLDVKPALQSKYEEAHDQIMDAVFSKQEEAPKQNEMANDIYPTEKENKARDRAFEQIISLNGVEQRSENVYYVPDKLMTPKRMKSVASQRAISRGDFLGMSKTDKYELMPMSELTGKRYDHGYAIRALRNTGKKRSDETGAVNIGLAKDAAKKVLEIVKKAASTKSIEFSHGLGKDTKNANVVRVGTIARLVSEGEQAVIDFNEGYRTFINEGKGRAKSAANRFKEAPEDMREMLNKFLIEQDPEVKQARLEALPEPMRESAERMRTTVDALSRQLRNEGVASKATAEKIENQEGYYLRRTFKIFKDPDWKNQISEKMKDAVRKHIAKEEELDPSSTEVTRILNGYMNIADNTEPSIVRRGKKLGTKDLSTLQKRGEFDQSILDLWGVEKDGIVNFLETLTAQANLIANHRFLRAVARIGEGKTVFSADLIKAHTEVDTDPSHPDFNDEYDRLIRENRLVPFEEGAAKKDRFNPSEIGRYGAMAGSMVERDFKEAMQEAVAHHEITGMLGELAFLNSVTKAGMTALSPKTASLNFWSNSFIAAQAHHLFYGSPKAIANRMRLAMKVARIETSTRHDKGIRTLGNKLIGLGVLKDTIGTTELQKQRAETKKTRLASLMKKAPEMADSAIEKVYGADPHIFKSISNALGMGVEQAFALYQAGDDVWKTFGWLAERDMLKEAYPNWSERQLDVESALRVRRFYTTYSELPNAVKTLRHNPLIAPFVAFYAEVPRGMANTMLQAKQDIVEGQRTGNTVLRNQGIKRAGSMMVAAATLEGISQYYKMKNDVDDDDEETLRMAQPSWDKAGTFGWYDIDRVTGKAKAYNLSAMVPQAIAFDPLTAFFRAETIGQGVHDFAKELASPLYQPEIGFMALRNQWYGIDSDNKPIFTESDPMGEQWYKRGAQFWKDMSPGAYKSVVNVSKAEDKVGKAFDELSGQRTVDVDLPKSLFYKAIALQKAGQEQNRDIGKAVKAEDREAIMEQYKQRIEAHKLAWREASDMIKGMKRFGVDDMLIVKSLKEAGLDTPRDRNRLINGNYVEPKMPDWIKKALAD